jgi:uncharacterized OsmC-like protein
MAVRAKTFHYAVDLHEGGSFRTEDGTPLETDPAWTPEHLLLAALVRCSLQSLRYHARRAGIEVAAAHGSADCTITKRESDERYGIVETAVDLEVILSPRPGDDEVDALTAKAERDCFIGASLTVKPAYRWTVR